jgi:hypothetical protein
MLLNTFLIAAQLLGFVNYIPPFATARGLEILRGVNYASGAAGIRDESGQTDVITRIHSCPYIYIHIEVSSPWNGGMHGFP